MTVPTVLLAVLAWTLLSLLAVALLAALFEGSRRFEEATRGHREPGSRPCAAPTARLPLAG